MNKKLKIMSLQENKIKELEQEILNLYKELINKKSEKAQLTKELRMYKIAYKVNKDKLKNIHNILKNNCK